MVLLINLGKIGGRILEEVKVISFGKNMDTGFSLVPCSITY